MDMELTTQRMKPTCKPYINFLLLMGIISWFLAACGLSSPKETERYGFDLPIDSTKAVWKDYLTDRFWHDTILIDNQLYLPRDQNKHKQLLEKQGIALMDAQTRKVRWHTDFPVEQTVSAYDSNQHSYVSSSTLILEKNRLFCAYLHIVPPQQIGKTDLDKNPKDGWEYVILEASTGKIIQKAKMPEARNSYDFVIVGDYWFIQDTPHNTIGRFSPATGKRLWGFPSKAKISTIANGAVSLIKRIDKQSWQAIVLDLDSGSVLFSKLFENLDKHVINAVIYKDGIAYVEMGAQKEMHLELGIRYSYYTIAFNTKTNKPLWRTPFS